MQDILYCGDVLKESEKCDFIQERDARPKCWITDQSKLIKCEVVERISSDDSDDEQQVYGGDLDTKFTYTKDNNNPPDKYVCDICEKVFRDTHE